MTYVYVILAAWAAYNLALIVNRLSRLVVGASVVASAMIAWLDHPDNPEELRLTAAIAREFLGVKNPASLGLKLSDFEQHEGGEQS
jgi:hypothetical protein